MYDFVKLGVSNSEQVKAILANPLLEFEQTYNRSTAELLEFPQEAKWKGFKIKVFSRSILQLTGSLHKYWNGTNENDFTLKHVTWTIDKLCNELKLDPYLVKVINLEFGLNLCPYVPTWDILSEIVCFKNKLSSKPYEKRPGYNLLEFDHAESYIKLYDKGRQLKVDNILRVEIKGIKSRYFNSKGIFTLSDLKKPETMRKLGQKIKAISKELVFKDTSIDINSLSGQNYKTYLRMKDPNEWIINGLKTTSHKRREKRFKWIVKQYGSKDLSSYIEKLIEEKLKTLLKESVPVFTP